MTESICNYGSCLHTLFRGAIRLERKIAPMPLGISTLMPFPPGNITFKWLPTKLMGCYPPTIKSLQLMHPTAELSSSIDPY